MIISEVLQAHWEGLTLALRTSDGRGNVTEMKVDPSARQALLLQLLGNTPDLPESLRITLSPIGMGTSTLKNAPGYMLHFLLPDNMSVQVAIPSGALQGVKAKIAALGETDTPAY